MSDPCTLRVGSVCDLLAIIVVCVCVHECVCVCVYVCVYTSIV